MTVDIDYSRDSKITEFGRQTLHDRYLSKGEDVQTRFATVAKYYSDNEEHAKRLYEYISNLWFMPATPILSNGGKSRGLPISCFLNECDDSLGGISGLWEENVWLASRGGGIGSYFGNVRSIGEEIKNAGHTSGIIPFLKVIDSMTICISQGSLRRGSTAVYLQIDHPEIEEFIDIRRPTGDANRRSLNIHHGVVVTDKFMHAVKGGLQWELKSPHTGEVMSTIPARELWIKLLVARVETGEPYILFIDAVKRGTPEHHAELGLHPKMSNLCSEITLPTGKDHLGNERTAVCCLSSLNLEYYSQWEGNEQFIEDVMRFLDNVLQDFIDRAPDEMRRAKYSAMRERSVGLGVMGFHTFLQENRVPMESVVAKSWNKRIFKHIKEEVDRVSVKLAEEKGACPDAQEKGVNERFSYKMAIAPTASISYICGECSPGIEPIASNLFVQKTLSGSFTVKNKRLKQLLLEKGKDNADIWSSIAVNHGSVQHLPFLSPEEKDVFKTAFEINQRWLIDHAADRTPYICQAQSLNLFMRSDISKKELHEVHFEAWQKGVKSLYYCRSKSIQRADIASEMNGNPMGQVKIDTTKGTETKTGDLYDECLACQ